MLNKLYILQSTVHMKHMDRQLAADIALIDSHNNRLVTKDSSE